MFHPGDREDTAHLRLHSIIRQAVVCRVEFTPRGRGAKLEQHHVLVGTAVVDDAHVLQVGVARRRKLEQVRRLVLRRHAKYAHHLGVGEGGRRLLLLLLLKRLLVFGCCGGRGTGSVFKEVDHPFGDLYKRIAGDEVKAILLTWTQLLGGPAR